MDFYLFWASAGQPSLCWPDNLLLGFCSLLSFHCSFVFFAWVITLTKLPSENLIAISAVIFLGLCFVL